MNEQSKIFWFFNVSNPNKKYFPDLFSIFSFSYRPFSIECRKRGCVTNSRKFSVNRKFRKITKTKFKNSKMKKSTNTKIRRILVTRRKIRESLCTFYRNRTSFDLTSFSKLNFQNLNFENYKKIRRNEHQKIWILHIIHRIFRNFAWIFICQ